MSLQISPSTIHDLTSPHNNNIWFILGNLLIQEGKHMYGKLEGKLLHYFGSKGRKSRLERDEENRAPKCSPNCLSWLSRTPFGVVAITFDSNIQMSCFLMIWKANKIAYTYVSNSHFQRRLLRGSNWCPKLELYLCYNCYRNWVVFFFVDFSSLVCKTYYFSLIQVISCLLKCSYI
jgi:hypothetical protein